MSEPKIDAAAAFRRFQDAMRALVRVPKKEVEERMAAERDARAGRKPGRKPA